MRGLLRKALTLHARGKTEEAAKPAELPTEDGGPQDESAGISIEEKREITYQIDRLMADNRIEVSPENLSYVSRRNGALLPLFSNITIFAAAIVALLVISQSLNRKEKSIATSGTTILTAESKLIATLKQEAGQQLQLKDRAIVDAQNKLNTVSKEKEQLRGQADSTIRAREQELKDRFDSIVAAERARLETQGADAAGVERKMRAFQDAQGRELAQQLARARQSAEAELAAKQQAFTSAETQYLSELETARQERLSLQSESRQKQTELQTQLEKEQQAEGEGARVAAELARLRAQQDQERLVDDQITAGYAHVNELFLARQYDPALAALASLGKILDNDSVGALPAVQRRRTVETFLIGSLEELVKARQSGKAAETTSAGQVSPTIDQVSQALRNGEATSRLREANVFFQAGNFQASIDRYEQSLGLLLNDKTLARQFADSLTTAGYRVLAAEDLGQLGRLKTAEQKRQEVITRLQDIVAQYKAYVALKSKSSVSDPGSPESLATLLQAKILLRQVLDTDPVHSQYPDLAAKTERYIDAVSAKARDDGRKESLDVLDSFFGKLQSGDKISVQSLARTSASGEQDPLLRLMDRLQAMLQ